MGCQADERKARSESALSGQDSKAPKASKVPQAKSALTEKKPHRVCVLKRALMCLLVLALCALGAAAVFVLSDLPEDFLARSGAVSVRFTDRHGRLLREVRSFADGRSTPLPPDEPIPPLVKAAFIAAEDRRFESHPGVDAVAVIRAAKSNAASGRIVSGASTIPMQLARMIRPFPKTYLGKAHEALWALRIAHSFDRERVLREYLNRIPLGRDLTGVEAAADFYFGRPAKSLSLAQAALLAAVARSPAASDPFRHLERARGPMEQVLLAMEETGAIDAQDRELALNLPLDLVRPESAFLAPHLVTHLVKQLKNPPLREAVTVETTLDLELQAAVEAAMREVIRSLEDSDVGNAAVIVLDNETGDVLAYAGSVDFFDAEHGGQNDGVRALRQPGSALKPFAYGLALMEGLTPATILEDLETHLSTPAGAYVPKNYDRHVHGPVRLRAALANSYNVPAVQIMERLGPERVLQVLRSAGFDSLTETASHYGVGLVLGNGEVTLRALARAYRGIARGGVAGPIREVRRAFDVNGKEISLQPERGETRFLSEDASALLTDILSDEAARASAFGHTNALRFPFPTAAKTGTSRAHVDNWVAGFTHERTVAVWVGNFSGKPMKGVSGITGAGPVFKRAMTLAMAGIDPKAPLIDAEKVRFETADICPLSGALAGPYCGGHIREKFLPGTAPSEICRVHSADGLLNLPPEYEEWALSLGLKVRPMGMDEVAAEGDLPRGNGASEGASASRPHMGLGEFGGRFLLPQDGDEFLLDPMLPLAAQSIRVRVSPPASVPASALFLKVVRRASAREDGRETFEEVPLDSLFGASLSLAQGRYEVSLWQRGAARPLSVIGVRVR